MVAWVSLLATAVCLCPSVSVTSRSSVETVERIGLVFDMGALFHLSYTVLQGNSGISNNKGTYLWNFAPNCGLKENFAAAYRLSN